MPRKRSRIPLCVFLNGRLVGYLNREPSGAIDFQYDRTWLDWEKALPVSLSMPLREARFIGAPVIAVFDNLLPDSEAIRREVAARVQADGLDAYSLLAALGRDCVGALQFLPEGVEPGPAGQLEGRPVEDQELAKLLRNLTRAPLGIGFDQEFRISLAGAQEKTALLRCEGRWYLPHGTTATTHILKPAIGTLSNGLDLSQSVENEYLCLRLTEAFGIPSARAEIGTIDGLRVLVVERFDRLRTHDGRLLRLPQEDFCQALSRPPSLKYEADGGPGIRDLLDQLQGSDDPSQDRKQLLKTQVVFWLLGATDGHAKNFSLFLYSGGRFRLTPMYDIMSAQPNVDHGQLRHNDMKLAMAVGKNRHYVIGRISPRHFAQTADQARLPITDVRDIFQELLRDVPQALHSTLNALPPEFPVKLAESIANGVSARLRTIEEAPLRP